MFDQWIPNFLLLNTNRNISTTYIISNNTLNLISSMHLGFCILPVSNSLNSESFELHLLDIHILKIRKYRHGGKLYNMHHFRYLQLDMQTYYSLKNNFYRKNRQEEVKVEEDIGSRNSLITFRRGTGEFKMSSRTLSRSLGINLVKQIPRSLNIEIDRDS